MQQRDFYKIFFALLILQLVVIFKPDEVLTNLSKPLPSIALLLFFTHKTSSNTPNRKLVIAALFCCALFDITQTEYINSHIIYNYLLIITSLLLTFFFYKENLKWVKKHIAITTTIGIAITTLISIFLTTWQTPLISILYGCIFSLCFITGSCFSTQNKISWYYIPLGCLLLFISSMTLPSIQHISGNLFSAIAIQLSYSLSLFLISIGILQYHKTPIPTTA